MTGNEFQNGAHAMAWAKWCSLWEQLYTDPIVTRPSPIVQPRSCSRYILVMPEHPPVGELGSRRACHLILCADENWLPIRKQPLDTNRIRAISWKGVPVGLSFRQNNEFLLSPSTLFPIPLRPASTYRQP